LGLNGVESNLFLLKFDSKAVWHVFNIKKTDIRMNLKKNITQISYSQILKYLVMVIFLAFFNFLFSQQDSLNKKRLRTAVITGSVSYVAIMTGLNSIWWDGQAATKFYTFNDNDSWLQMDKVGHALTGYYVGLVGYESLRWAGVKKKKALIYGGTLGSVFLSSVEVLDGFSARYGTSWGDVIANSAGTGMFLAQEIAWDEQRILLKYSYHKTKYIPLSKGRLGENFIENTIIDYNGQTYWMSANVSSFLRKDTQFPKWLNIAGGYGADGLLGPVDNPPEYSFDRHRQYYISLDIDLTRVKTKSKFVNTIFTAFGFIKFPMPTIEFNEGGKVKFYAVYF